MSRLYVPLKFNKANIHFLIMSSNHNGFVLNALGIPNIGLDYNADTVEDDDNKISHSILNISHRL